MKKVFRGTPEEISQEIKEELEQRGLTKSANDEMYQEILMETLTT